MSFGKKIIGRTMITIREIIGWEEPGHNPKASNTEDSRPDSCPNCFVLARDVNGRIVLVGHGSYERWANIPQGIKIRIQRFRCKSCRSTCSVLPHWLLPRYQYIAPIILSSLNQFYIDGVSASKVTKHFPSKSPKHGWGTLHRWGASFLLSPFLWGWLGRSFGATEGVAISRTQIRHHLEMFFRSYVDRVTTAVPDCLSDIVRMSLVGGVFDRGGKRASVHTKNEEKSTLFPLRTRLEAPTQGGGPVRGPP